MNILKLRSFFFSLMAIAMLTVFLSSCEDNIPLPSDQIQKSETPNALQNDIEKMGEISFELPTELTYADSETVERYLADLTAEQINEREESFKTEKYLESIGRLGEVYNDLGLLDVLKLNDISKYLTEQELVDFHSFDINATIELLGYCETLSTFCYPFDFASKGKITSYKIDLCRTRCSGSGIKVRNIGFCN